MNSRVVAMVIVVFTIWLSGAHAQEGVIDFHSDRWVLKDAEIVTHLGRTALCGLAYLKDVDFDNGVIEVDVAVSGARSYPGLVFHMTSENEFERFYMRPHRAGLYPDALHYTPVFNGVTCWQLYHGKGFTAPATLSAGQWIHVKMEILGRQARVFLDDDDEPALVIHDLKHGAGKGMIGVMGPKNETARFSGFRYRITDDLDFAESPQAVTHIGTLSEWDISRPYQASRVDRTRYPHFFQIFNARWQPVTAEASGLVNLSRHIKRPGTEPHCALARTVVRSDRKRDVKLSLGYSDDVTLFLNGKPVFSGVSGYRSRDRSFLGLVGLHDTVYLPLEKGLNEICLMVTESFGGWGFVCQADRALDPPIRRHELLTRVWETPAVFKIPESVLYDAQRHVLYVSSFDKVDTANDHTGFISRVALDGRIEELKWVTGLDGPCGMGVYQDRLFVVEGSLGNLVEIDIDSGAILNRLAIPGSTFLNDIAIDRLGNIYISNTSRAPKGTDIYKCRDGHWEVWAEGYDIHRSNGLFIHDNSLLVGNTGDSSLKRIDLRDGSVSTEVCLGAGVVDGVRVDNEGNYLVSHWEGQAYRISPDGEVVEILETMGEGLNIADFEFIKDENLLLIPTFLGNKVVAYRLAVD